MNAQAIYSSLVQGVEKFHFGGTAVPSQLLLASDMTVPVAVSPSGQVLIAASRYGKGRIVVMAHETYMEDPHFGQFLQNAIKWLKPKQDDCIGVCKRPHLAEHLSKTGFKIKSLAEYDGSVGVFCCDAYSDHQTAKLVEFVKGGGGLLIGGQAWHWSCSHKEDVLQSFPGNKITGVAGIFFTSIYGKKGSFPVPKDIPHQSVFVLHGKDIKQDLSILLDGVTEFDLSGQNVPSALLVHGPLAFPVAQNDSGQVFLAAAHYGGGRVVVIPHEDYLNQPALQRLVLNAVGWLDAERKGEIYVSPKIKHLCTMLSTHHFNTKASALGNGASVYCCTSYSDDQAEEIHCFVAEGGGLLMAGQAWWWACSNNGQDPIAGYPGNRILNRFGIGILKYTIDAKVYKAASVAQVSEYPHFLKELSKIIDHVKMNKPLGELAPSLTISLKRNIASFLEMDARQNPLYTMILQELINIFIKSGVLKVSPEHPVKSPVQKFLLHFANTLYRLNPGKLAPAIPVLFHKLNTASAVRVAIDGTNKGPKAWRSTGLSVYPGKPVTVRVPSALTGKGLQVQIGCHTDNLSELDELKRAPVVTQRFPVNAERVEVSTLWGGLLYIIVPADCQLGIMDIVVEEAARAPYFKLGVTSVSEWQSTGRHHPGPWAELEADSIIVTVPSKDVRHLDDPTPLLTLWNHIMKAVAKLAGCPSPFLRPERIVTDIQISAGWMHSGYPIMAQLKSVKELIQVDYMKSAGVWGPTHELGHNQQKEMWEFPPHTGEATCNLWSVYIHETVLHIPREKAHGDLKPEMREERIKAYINGGAKLENWSVWTCLETYLQLQEGFGWKPFIQLFTEYKSIPHRVMTKEEKMNLWAEKFSQEVKMNLIPFFKTWGWPIEDRLAMKLSSLPTWDKNPMKNYI
ncbi:TRPM8 channel-associated factor homolog [Scleropages formosus]|uniref:TRPM8 channel-associated factor homolog n=1 Tax=Scleropages formosus TaxID=113540 RepID=UPI0010FA7386|nr:TRPM8 channel-associated factor homolog [Scleropages formosus]XP_018593141.2 TRPM8 channel-associated factor homolog [Scleropages formosus]XP_018593142.2 TRPM8 channel-associated factor homolog [Scleropages formosus]